MNERILLFNARQLLFKELFVGTLIYAVVLGLFDDYTDIVYITSFSFTLFAAVVLEILTYLAFLLKNQIIAWLRGRSGVAYRALMFFCVWLVMFLSKFVFVGALNYIFGDNVNVYGFFGILTIVICVTIVHKLADLTFIRLGDESPKNKT